MQSTMSALAFFALSLPSLIQAHTLITYPPWRGNNLITNATFPFGMGRQYPCGGIPPTTNRTNWPLDGSGTVAFQPGWFAGHALNFVYVNLCFPSADFADEGANGIPEAANCSVQILGPLEARGPSNNPYPGTLCLPSIGLPEGVTPRNGDLASIQIVQVQAHGGALYSCSDIIFTDDASSVPPVTENNCFNSTGLSISGGRFVSDTKDGSGGPSPTSAAPPPPPGASTPGNSGAAAVVARGSGIVSKAASALLVFLHWI